MLDRTNRRGRSAPRPWEFSARVGLKRKGENGAGGLQFARATFQHKQKKKKGKKKVVRSFDCFREQDRRLQSGASAPFLPFLFKMRGSQPGSFSKVVQKKRQKQRKDKEVGGCWAPSV